MKRYAAFAWATYEAGGGWDDFIGAFETEAEALAAIEAERARVPGIFDNARTVDLQKIMAGDPDGDAVQTVL